MRKPRYLGWPLTASGQADDLDELRGILDRLLAMNPEHPGVPFWLYHSSVAQVCAGRVEAALAPIEEALEQSPDFALGWMHYANLLGMQGRSGEAREATARAREINPAMTPAHYRRLIGKLSSDRAVIEARTSGL